jgi:hypothetical protein
MKEDSRKNDFTFSTEGRLPKVFKEFVILLAGEE